MINIDHRTIAADLVRKFGSEVPLEAIQERLDGLGVDYDHTDIEQIEYLIDQSGGDAA